MYALATEGWMMYAFTVVYCLGGIAGPALQGIMSNTIPANEQGELQGGLTSLVSISAIIGPFIMNSLLFTYFTGPNTPVYLPGAPMLFGAILCVIATLIARSTLKKNPVVAEAKSPPVTI
jgi:DHA1 family tetracycline resistance protein-like MFS transporter